MSLDKQLKSVMSFVDWGNSLGLLSSGWENSLDLLSIP